MRPDQEIREDPPWTRPSLCFPPADVGAERPPRRAPHRFVEIPIDGNPCLPAKRIKEPFIPGGRGQQLREDRRCYHQAASSEGGIQRRTRLRIQRFVFVPQRCQDVRINRRGHRPRSSRTQRTTPFLPRAIPELPMPRYFSNGLLILTGRTRTSLPSFAKSSLSPAPTPSARRISCGTVTCPLLVIRASFFMLNLPIPYSSTLLLTSQAQIGKRAVT